MALFPCSTLHKPGTGGGPSPYMIRGPFHGQPRVVRNIPKPPEMPRISDWVGKMPNPDRVDFPNWFQDDLHRGPCDGACALSWMRCVCLWFVKARCFVLNISEIDVFV